MKNIVLLGSTGSVGQNVADVVRRFPEKFNFLALSTRANLEAITGQVRSFSPRAVSMDDEDACASFRKAVSGVDVFPGNEGLELTGAVVAWICNPIGCRWVFRHV